jgi:hypothetical protein
MSGLRNPWAPSITDANGDVWSQSNPTGGEGGGASLLMKNGEILRTYNGSPAPGGIEVFNWLVYGGSYGVQFWASNFHAYGITQVDGVDMYIDQGASSGDDHTSAFAFPFYFDALSPVDVAVPNGSLTIFTNQIVTSVPGANYHTSGDISLELGTLFNVTAPIQITHIRFYRPSVVYPSPFDGIPTNPYNIGRIWDAHGSLLVEKLCPVQSAEGWQQMALDSPLRLPTANGYVVTVSSWVLEAYTHTDGVFVTPLVRGPVTAMSGVYGPVNTFPNNTSWAPNFVHGGHPFNQSSFFRDVVFVPDAPPEPP